MRIFKATMVAYLLATSASLAACTSRAEISGPISSPPSDPQPVAVMAVSDLAVGENRLAFGLFDLDGREITNASIDGEIYYLGGETPEKRAEIQPAYASFEIETPHQHDDGELHAHVDSRGVYVIPSARLDKPGPWGLALEIAFPGQAAGSVTTVPFQVREESSTPSVGSLAPASRSPVAHSEAELADICSRVPPDHLHAVSVEAALESGRVAVVAFASPSFCQSRLCGPITDVVLSLEGIYGERAAFIHIEPYDLDLIREEGRLELTSVATEWGLPSEPWVFVVDDKGLISAKFEGIFSPGELEQAIQLALGDS